MTHERVDRLLSEYTRSVLCNDKLINSNNLYTPRNQRTRLKTKPKTTTRNIDTEQTVQLVEMEMLIKLMVHVKTENAETELFGYGKQKINHTLNMFQCVRACVVVVVELCVRTSHIHAVTNTGKQTYII